MFEPSNLFLKNTIIITCMFNADSFSALPHKITDGQPKHKNRSQPSVEQASITFLHIRDQSLLDACFPHPRSLNCDVCLAPNTVPNIFLNIVILVQINNKFLDNSSIFFKLTRST